MINVNVNVDHKFWSKKIKNPKSYLKKKVKKITKLLSFANKKNTTFTVLMTNSSKIKKLNKKFRNINKTTDVLSFPFYSLKDLRTRKEQNIYLGDIAVSYDFVNIRSQDSNFFLEFDKLWIHGFLHLLGYDHIKNKDYKKMHNFEKKIISLI